MEMSNMKDSRQLEDGMFGIEAPTVDIAETAARVYQGREAAAGMCTSG